MAKRFGFFNSINGDRKYLATDISKAFDVAVTTGLQAIPDSFKVVPNDGMTVKMLPGGCMIYGAFCVDNEEEIIELDVADGELNRIDRIAVRYDRFERSIKTVVIKGTPALNPTAPAPLRDENQFDLVLADIAVNKAVTSITASNITDMRYSELCGFIGVKGAVTQEEFDRHLADYAKLGSQTIIAAREVGLAGTQRFLTKHKPKSILITAVSNARFSIGMWSEDGDKAYAIIIHPADGRVVTNSGYGEVTILEETTGHIRFTGIIDNVTETGFDLIWETYGSLTLAGSISLRMQILHG